MENYGRREEPIAATSSILAEADLAKKLSRAMHSMQELIDSPKTHFILRNTALTLLELPDHSFDLERAYLLLTNNSAREKIVRELLENTPEIWSETWNSLRLKETDPLYTAAQQHCVTRVQLARFWTKEWETIPEETRVHVANLLATLR